jgi:hypothetical protein
MVPLAANRPEAHPDGDGQQEVVMVIDREEARIWADHHKEFGRWASSVAHEIAEAFRVLARLQYDQPWKRPGRPGSRH